MKISNLLRPKKSATDKKHRPNPNRPVFGFPCDEHLASRVRFVAYMASAPIYTAGEHLMQLGLAHIGLQIERNPEGFEGVEKELHEHLVNAHLLVDELGDETYEQKIILANAQLAPAQQRLVHAALNLARQYEAEGMPQNIATEIVENMVAIAYEKARSVQIKRQLARDEDFAFLREAYRRSPDLVMTFLRITTKYPPEELARVLSPPKQ